MLLSLIPTKKHHCCISLWRECLFATTWTAICSSELNAVYNIICSAVLPAKITCCNKGVLMLALRSSIPHGVMHMEFNAHAWTMKWMPNFHLHPIQRISVWYSHWLWCWWHIRTWWHVRSVWWLCLINIWSRKFLSICFTWNHGTYESKWPPKHSEFATWCWT